MGDGRKHCDACADEGDEKGLPRARMLITSGLNFVLSFPRFCDTATSNAAANIGCEGMRRLNMYAHKFATSSKYTVEHKRHVSKTRARKQNKSTRNVTTARLNCYQTLCRHVIMFNHLFCRPDLCSRNSYVDDKSCLFGE
jgi:hypothetical protein